MVIFRDTPISQSARILGFDLMTNFQTPYFSRDIAEFWRRWHISLSSWFKDYLYIPLGGSKGGKYKIARNTFIIFLVSGFWHGANWTFIIWGLLNALYFLPLLLQNKNRIHLHNSTTGIPDIKELGNIMFTFGLTCIAWVFFRAKSFPEGLDYFQNIFTNQFIPTFRGDIINVAFNQPILMFMLMLCILFMLFLEWKTKNYNHGLDVGNWNKINRHLAYYSTMFLIIFYGTFEENSFIYFQF